MKSEAKTKKKGSKMNESKEKLRAVCAQKNEIRSKLKGLFGDYRRTLEDLKKSIEEKITAADLGNPQYAIDMTIEKEEERLAEIKESIFKITDEDVN